MAASTRPHEDIRSRGRDSALLRAAIVLDPATSPRTAMRIVGSLFWRDLARVADDSRLHPPLRRRAELLLRDRYTDLSEGEMIALARVAGRTLVPTLAASGSPLVIAALLGNSHMVAGDVVAIARRPNAPAAILSVVAASERWRTTRVVRLALTLNPSTPVADALRCLHGLVGNDLKRLASDPSVPTIIRVGAERILLRARAVASEGFRE